MTNYALIFGCILVLVLLTPAMAKTISHAMNRRLARKLAKGPVGLLLKHDFNFAMELSKKVSKGDLSVAEVTKIAEHCLWEAGKVGQEAQCKSIGRIKWPTK